MKNQATCFSDGEREKTASLFNFEDCFRGLHNNLQDIMVRGLIDK